MPRHGRRKGRVMRPAWPEMVGRDDPIAPTPKRSDKMILAVLQSSRHGNVGSSSQTALGRDNTQAFTSLRVSD